MASQMVAARRWQTHSLWWGARGTWHWPRQERVAFLGQCHLALPRCWPCAASGWLCWRRVIRFGTARAEVWRSTSTLANGKHFQHLLLLRWQQPVWVGG